VKAIPEEKKYLKLHLVKMVAGGSLEYMSRDEVAAELVKDSPTFTIREMYLDPGQVFPRVMSPEEVGEIAELKEECRRIREEQKAEEEALK
jgi:hypothetical protein